MWHCWNPAWWHMPVIPIFGRWRQENLNLKVTLGYRARGHYGPHDTLSQNKILLTAKETHCSCLLSSVMWDTALGPFSSDWKLWTGMASHSPPPCCWVPSKHPRHLLWRKKPELEKKDPMSLPSVVWLIRTWWERLLLGSQYSTSLNMSQDYISLLGSHNTQMTHTELEVNCSLWVCFTWTAIK